MHLHHTCKSKRTRNTTDIGLWCQNSLKVRTVASNRLNTSRGGWHHHRKRATFLVLGDSDRLVL